MNREGLLRMHQVFVYAQADMRSAENFRRFLRLRDELAQENAATLPPTFLRWINAAVDEILELIPRGGYEQAADLAKAFEPLAQKVAAGEDVDYGAYFRARVKPLRKRWGKAAVEGYVVTRDVSHRG